MITRRLRSCQEYKCARRPEGRGHLLSRAGVSVSPYELVTAATAARNLGCSRQRVYRWVQLGKLHPILPGLYRWDDVIAAESATGASPFSHRSTKVA